MFVFKMAQDFFEQGIKSVKEAHPPRFRLKNETPWKISLPICLLSFSLELALKGFLTNDVKQKLMSDKKGHKLAILYKNIPLDSRIAIENHFETCRAHNYYFFNIIYRSRNQQSKLPVESPTREKILDTLERCNDAFIQFRYLHEFKNSVYYFDFNTIIKLIHSCLAVKANDLGVKP